MIALMVEEQATNEKKAQPRLRYANALHAPVAAVINGLFRFRDQAQAHGRLEKLRGQYTHVSERADWAETPSDTPFLLLWIRNFELSEAEEQAGYLGHYARITCCQMADEDGLYSLQAEKIERPLKFHPQRKRPQARCPNWGHPVLRNIKKVKHYASLEEASGQLAQLHLEYPETTIPGVNKLYLMIFSREDSPSNPLGKYILEIVNEHGGGFTIVANKNEYKPRAVKTPSDTQVAPLGHFSSMVALKQKRKRKSE